MGDISRTFLVGRLVKDAKLEYTQGGDAVVKFIVAVNRRRKRNGEYVDEANFFEVKSFGRQGESIAKYLVKGQQVAVDCQARQDRWEASDGSKRSRVYFDSYFIQLLGEFHLGERRDSEERSEARVTQDDRGPGGVGFSDDILFD
jgi:single-strand DNA-binding protein